MAYSDAGLLYSLEKGRNPELRVIISFKSWKQTDGIHDFTLMRKLKRSLYTQSLTEVLPKNGIRGGRQDEDVLRGWFWNAKILLNHKIQDMKMISCIHVFYHNG